LADLAYRYIEYFIYGLPFIMPMFAMDNFLRACGKAKYNMTVNIFVSILNIFLDWLFIAYLGYGIEFSAISSVGSILIGTIFSFAPFFGKKMALHFTKPKISLREAWGIVYNGSSEFLSSISNAFMATVINIMLLNLGGSVAVASYGIVMYIDVLLIGALYGVLDSVQPVVSYNVGAKEIKRAFSFFRITCVATAVLSGVCMAVIMIFPQALASIFAKDNNAEIIKMTTSALLLFAPSYLFTWFNMSASAFLTAIDKPKESMIIMLFRTVSPFVCVFALSSFMGVYGVYFTATVAGALTVIVSIVISINAKRKLKKQCVPAVQAVELQEKATENYN
ncbi:MAG: MATE family efflux transporter, partial [Clostridia bacterium]